jgi:hypothetical protein
MACVCPAKRATSRPEAASQTRAVRSALPVTTCLPSGRKKAAVMESQCPTNFTGLANGAPSALVAKAREEVVKMTQKATNRSQHRHIVKPATMPPMVPQMLFDNNSNLFSSRAESLCSCTRRKRKLAKSVLEIPFDLIKNETVRGPIHQVQRLP